MLIFIELSNIYKCNIEFNIIPFSEARELKNDKLLSYKKQSYQKYITISLQISFSLRF